MESQRLGERQGFPHIAGPPLTDRVMPALDMSPLARWLVHGGVGRLGEDGSIGRPEAPIGFRLLTGGLRRRPRPAETFRSFRPRNSRDVLSLGRPEGLGYGGRTVPMETPSSLGRPRRLTRSG